MKLNVDILNLIVFLGFLTLLKINSFAAASTVRTDLSISHWISGCIKHLIFLLFLPFCSRHSQVFIIETLSCSLSTLGRVLTETTWVEPAAKDTLSIKKNLADGSVRSRCHHLDNFCFDVASLALNWWLRMISARVLIEAIAADIVTTLQHLCLSFNLITSKTAYVQVELV